MNILYNDNDKHVCQWLRQLIADGQLPPGVVTEKGVEALTPGSVLGHERVHLFAGIGGWELAAQIAGWTGPLWTGSCPCQPFSSAGKQKGFDDARHVWPHMRSLIAKCRPAIVVGEQVASKRGREWLARVFDEMEGLGYACAGADLCAASAGAPHIRQRLFWVSYACREPGERIARGLPAKEAGVGGADGMQHGHLHDGPANGGQAVTGGIPDRLSPRLEGHAGHGDRGLEPGWEQADAAGSAAESGGTGRLPDADHQSAGPGVPREQGQARLWGDRPPNGGGTGRLPDADSRGHEGEREQERARLEGEARREPDGHRDYWSEWRPLAFRDGKVRRIEPGTQPLAHGVSGRLALERTADGKAEVREYSRRPALKGLGNAIVPQVGAMFLREVMAITGCGR